MRFGSVQRVRWDRRGGGKDPSLSGAEAEQWAHPLNDAYERSQIYQQIYYFLGIGNNFTNSYNS